MVSARYKRVVYVRVGTQIFVETWNRWSFDLKGEPSGSTVPDI